MTTCDAWIEIHVDAQLGPSRPGAVVDDGRLRTLVVGCEREPHPGDDRHTGSGVVWHHMIEIVGVEP